MSTQNVSNYKISALIHENFNDVEIDTVDFKRHLKAGIALNKEVTKGDDGRPVKAEYYYNSIKHCEIVFTFTVDSNNLMTNRKESLYYVHSDNSLSPEIVIKDKTYNMNKLEDAELVMRERVEARVSIIQMLKAFAAGFLQQDIPDTLPNVIALITPFWDDYQVQRNHFVELGAETFKDDIAAIDTSTDYTWLARGPVNANGDDLQTYFVDRLSY